MLLLCATPVCCHVIRLIVSETFGECVTSSARLVWLICAKPWHAKRSAKYVQVCAVEWERLHMHIYTKMRVTPPTRSCSPVVWLLGGDTGVNEGSHCEWQPPSLTLIRDTGLQSQTARHAWCPSWPDTGWHSPRPLSACVCVFMCALGRRAIEYCSHHLLPYESCCSPGGEMVPRLLFPSALLRGRVWAAGWSKERDEGSRVGGFSETFPNISQQTLNRQR